MLKHTMKKQKMHPDIYSFFPNHVHGFDLIMKIPPYLVNEHYDDRYFDVVNAIEEAKHVFFRGTGLIDILSATGPGRKEFRIGETGFGAGRLLIALMDFLDNCGITDVAITYNSVEMHPVTSERMASILGGFRTEVGPLIDLIVRNYRRVEISRPGWHRMHSPGLLAS